MFQQILDQLIERVPEALAATFNDRDGEPICSRTHLSASDIEVELRHGHLLPVSQSNAVRTPRVMALDTTRASHTVTFTRCGRAAAKVSAANLLIAAGAAIGLKRRMSMT